MEKETVSSRGGWGSESTRRVAGLWRAAGPAGTLPAGHIPARAARRSPCSIGRTSRGQVCVDGRSVDPLARSSNENTAHKLRTDDMAAGAEMSRAELIGQLRCVLCVCTLRMLELAAARGLSTSALTAVFNSRYEVDRSPCPCIRSSPLRGRPRVCWTLLTVPKGPRVVAAAWRVGSYS